ncbi:MAG: hypothetical protein EZS26_001316 [Candidatus Ordinivivax streblomastigis]|uniref:Cell division protein FtsQ n=1 Tax=Candidatus Ordinivivax streblomastigis TaxID=2540710 RepID=A0A5M8P263_9BACT|nr:MAG: hypothetical protein EZS26_001316 [Candidatus Ordinivivax streblomastigis]
MWKEILQIITALLLLIYLGFAVAFINPKADTDNVCTQMHIEVINNRSELYLTEAQVLSWMNQAGVNPTGKKMSSIQVEAIEKALKKSKLVKKAETYKTIDGSIKIKIYQRFPILRVISSQGRNYYVDDEGKIMPVPVQFAAYVPLATGNISEAYAQKQLYDFVAFLHKHPSWNEDIEQIHVLPNLDVELIPNKGNHIILLGKLEQFKENLDKLELFYHKVLNKTGWNRYSVINLKYKNQVVCTKRE